MLQKHRVASNIQDPIFGHVNSSIKLGCFGYLGVLCQGVALRELQLDVLVAALCVF